MVIGFLFVGCAIYAAVTASRLDNRVTAQAVANSAATQIASCLSGNDTRADAKAIATSGVEADAAALASDEALWDSVDETFPSGLPANIRAALDTSFKVRQDGLDARQTLIESTYRPRDCDALARELGAVDDASASLAG